MEINDAALRDLLDRRLQTRNEMLRSLVTMGTQTLKEAANMRGLDVPEGESALQLIGRIVEWDYPELNEPLPRRSPQTPTSTEVRDDFEPVERADPCEFSHIAKPSELTVSVGYHAEDDGTGESGIALLEVLEYQRTTEGALDRIIVRIPHNWLDVDYVKGFVRSVHASALSGEIDNVLDTVIEIKGEQGWNDGYLHPDMTEDAVLGRPTAHDATQMQAEVYRRQNGEANTEFLPAHGTPEFEAEVQRRQDERSNWQA